MSKLIQIRNVPDALHRALKVRAAERGVSLSDLLLEELRRYAERPTLDELRHRLQGPPRGRLRESPAQALRAERQAR